VGLGLSVRLVLSLTRWMLGELIDSPCLKAPSIMRGRVVAFCLVCVTKAWTPERKPIAAQSEDAES